MSKIIIIEGNSNDKDNVRALMVKGEPGANGVSPTVSVSKSNGVTTVTITDAEGVHTATINDGEVSEAELTAGLATKVSNTNDNTTSVNFAENGTATITRRGNVVTVFASISLEASEARTLSNKATLPDWALPSVSINPTDTNKTVRSSAGVDMNMEAKGYILIRTTLKEIAIVAANSSTTDTRSLTLTFSYIVD